MDNYKDMINVNMEKQNMINEIKTISKSLDDSERAVREKIELRLRELDSLNREYINVVETYGHIVRSFVK